jgi:hypothetical protein
MNRTLLSICTAALLVQPAFAAKELRCAAVVPDSAPVKKGVVPSFSATAVLDVVVLLQFKNDDAKELADGDHVAEVRFYGPQGFLYESRMVPLTSDTMKASTTKSMAGFRRPLKRQLVTISKSGKELEARVALPVAATSIVSNSMYGTWRAEAYLDGSPNQCSDAASFVITQ